MTGRYTSLDTMSSEKPKYEMKIRAERQRQTRERIVAATVALHEQVGPARTTISEVARRAGVKRMTVYNNFPDDDSLLGACQAHWLALHPPPDPTPAFALQDPAERLQTVLSGLYAWYRENEQMLANIQRDRSLLPALEARAAATFDPQFAQLADALTTGWQSHARLTTRLHAAIALALNFWTWRCLAQVGLDDETAAELMADAATCAATPTRQRLR